MAITLYFHPLASFCWKPLVALYENETPFTPVLVDLGNEASRTSFLKVWAMGEFPVLRDEGKARTIPQSAAIIEYLHLYYPGKLPLIPADPDRALETRRWDSFYDSYVQVPMQKIVADAMRPEGRKDLMGVEEARSILASAFDILEEQLKTSSWTVGADFTMADCSAAPALFYADLVQPFGKTHPRLAAYLERIKARPSFARVLKEAEPYFHMFPYKG
jgi:glutathione S-transferase